jgi:hypothetical protein
MAYVQANILRLPCSLIHAPREQMIEGAQLHQDTLEELYVKECPYLFDHLVTKLYISTSWVYISTLCSIQFY